MTGNVGIVFCPTLGILVGVFGLILGDFNRVFDVDASKDISKEKTGELSWRNSRQYMNAALISFLGCRVGHSKGALWLYVLQITDHPSPRLAVSDEVELREADDSLSFQYESGNDTTENEATVKSGYMWSSANLLPSHYSSQTMDTLSLLRSDVPTSERRFHASNVAASCGLNITVNKKSNWQSRIMGLPLSPRPPAESPHLPVVSALARPTKKLIGFNSNSCSQRLHATSRTTSLFTISA